MKTINRILLKGGLATQWVTGVLSTFWISRERIRKDGGSISPDVCTWRLRIHFSFAQKFTTTGLTYIRQQVKVATYPNSNREAVKCSRKSGSEAHAESSSLVTVLAPKNIKGKK